MEQGEPPMTMAQIQERLMAEVIRARANTVFGSDRAVLKYVRKALKRYADGIAERIAANET